MGLIMTKKLTENECAVIGEKWADFLNLRKSKNHPDRYDIHGGDKTALGIYHTLRRLINEDGTNGLID